MNDQLMKMIAQMMGGGSGGMMGAGGGASAGMGGSAAGGLAGAAGGALSMSTPILPLVEGGIGLVSSFIKQKQANKLKEQLSMPDPNLSKFMGEIDRQRKSFESGSAYGAEIKELKNQQAATNEGITRLAKGNTGSALMAMSLSGLNTNRAYSDIAAKGEERKSMYDQMYGNMIQRLEQRKYEQNMDFYNQANIDARDARVKALQQLTNAAAMSQANMQKAGQMLMM